MQKYFLSMLPTDSLYGDKYNKHFNSIINVKTFVAVPTVVDRADTV